MINNLTHCKLIILNNEYYKILYNIEIIILIVPKVTIIYYFDYKWMCSWSVIENEMKWRHGCVLHVLKISTIVTNLVM
jgi:hypothetical protein